MMTTSRKILPAVHTHLSSRYGSPNTLTSPLRDKLFPKRLGEKLKRSHPNQGGELPVTESSVEILT